jgi:histone deacetylase 1/2
MALLANCTWDLVQRPKRSNVVTSKWVFTHKRLADGSLERYKARCVLQGFTQRPGVDYDETFSPVVKPATVRTVLTLALARSWSIHQLDVKNAFLHSTLTRTVYCSQPTGFVDPAQPEMVCRLNKSLYGLKQAPRRGTTDSLPSSSLWGSLRLVRTLRCSSTARAVMWHICSCMWMTSSLQPLVRLSFSRQSQLFNGSLP